MSRIVTDMLGRKVVVPREPRRIVSLVPSQTELLYHLSVDESVVGITKFCVHPTSWFKNKERVGGTKQLNLEKIRSLRPDLIIANKEENEQLQIEELAKEFPVWVSDVYNVEDALKMIISVGALVCRAQEANRLAASVDAAFAGLKRSRVPCRVAYFIWYRPWMSVGKHTFIHDVLQRAGWDNIIADEARYPEVDLEQLKSKDPQVLLLSSEPFPFREKHAAELRQHFPEAIIKFVDGEMFSWYGSRMMEAAKYILRLQRELEQDF